VKKLWRIYKTGEILAEVEATSARYALDAYVESRGLRGAGHAQGHAAVAIPGVGLLRAERVERPVPAENLPSTDRMRDVLKARGHDDANLISGRAVELRYRANVLDEFITPDMYEEKP